MKRTVVLALLLTGCAAHHPKPLPSNRVVAMAPIPNPPVAAPLAPAAPVAKQLASASNKALTIAVKPNTNADVIAALRLLDKQAADAVRAAERHPTTPNLRRARDSVGALDDYLTLQGAP